MLCKCGAQIHTRVVASITSSFYKSVKSRSDEKRGSRSLLFFSCGGRKKWKQRIFLRWNGRSTNHLFQINLIPAIRSEGMENLYVFGFATLKHLSRPYNIPRIRHLFAPAHSLAVQSLESPCLFSIDCLHCTITANLSSDNDAVYIAAGLIDCRSSNRRQVPFQMDFFYLPRICHICPL